MLSNCKRNETSGTTKQNTTCAHYTDLPVAKSTLSFDEGNDLELAKVNLQPLGSVAADLRPRTPGASILLCANPATYHHPQGKSYSSFTRSNWLDEPSWLDERSSNQLSSCKHDKALLCSSADDDAVANVINTRVIKLVICSQHYDDRFAGNK